MKLIITWLLLPSLAFAQTVRLQKIYEGITSPVAMANAGDGSNRLFVCEQSGKIRIIKNNNLMPGSFIDLRNRMIKQFNLYSERGLLGLAFHPKYRINHKFYVYYSAESKTPKSNHVSILSEFHALSNDPDKADPGSERIIMRVEQPESNHNGGQIIFGQDGYLYIGLGDGGGAGDEHGENGNGQDLNTLLGKILRIDINSGNPYRIPPDNPFVGKPGKDEIWAYGLRNPWKFSIDETTGRLFCADVGQDEWEEVDIIEKGKNYGWRLMEGNHCYNPRNNCNQNDLELPVSEYSHKEGISIIGGHIYRGKNPAWQGKYVFGDWKGKLFAISLGADNKWTRSELTPIGVEDKFYINSFGEDEHGEIYILTLRGIGPDKPYGIVYKMVF